MQHIVDAAKWSGIEHLHGQNLDEMMSCSDGILAVNNLLCRIKVPKKKLAQRKSGEVAHATMELPFTSILGYGAFSIRRVMVSFCL